MSSIKQELSSELKELKNRAKQYKEFWRSEEFYSLNCDQQGAFIQHLKDVNDLISALEGRILMFDTDSVKEE